MKWKTGSKAVAKLSGKTICQKLDLVGQRTDKPQKLQSHRTHMWQEKAGNAGKLVDRKSPIWKKKEKRKGQPQKNRTNKKFETNLENVTNENQ